MLCDIYIGLSVYSLQRQGPGSLPYATHSRTDYERVDCGQQHAVYAVSHNHARFREIRIYFCGDACLR
jgi:hypothetical protein